MTDPSPCPDAELTAVTALVARDEAAGLEEIDRLICDYPDDARLHFLRGSVLASQQEIEEGRKAMEHALALAPDYGLVRFQLGLLDLSSGEADAALRIWAPLDALPDGEPLKLFATGLRHLAADEFEACRACLERGIAANEALPEMNDDMRLILEQLPGAPTDGSSTETSETQLLLQRYSSGETQH